MPAPLSHEDLNARLTANHITTPAENLRRDGAYPFTCTVCGKGWNGLMAGAINPHVGCPNCKAHQRLRERGFTVTGATPLTVFEDGKRYEFTCGKGHTWDDTISAVLTPTKGGCPDCIRIGNTLRKAKPSNRPISLAQPSTMHAK